MDVASDRQASDIVMLDIRKVSDFADFFVILTAESTRQIDDLTDEIENALESLGEDAPPYRGDAERRLGTLGLRRRNRPHLPP